MKTTNNKMERTNAIYDSWNKYDDKGNIIHSKCIQ